MPTYVEPERWNDKSRESATRSRKLKDEVAEGTNAQRYNYVFGTHSKSGRDNYAAINKELNLKEEESEALDQRALDQYPKGTTAGSRTSRNRAGYGKPVDLPDADTGKREGGMTEDDKKAAQYRKEAKSGGTDAPVPSSVTQEVEDKKAAAKATVAPTTKTQMGKPFSKGGTASARADGIAQRGKTKGTFVMCGGGMARGKK